MIEYPDLPTEEELMEQAAEYAANSVDNFDDYEHQYFQYLEREESHPAYYPAVSVRDLFLRPKLPITSYVDGFLYAGCINLIGGEPKAGKSTLAWHLINNLSFGMPFLGTSTRKTNVVYVTEQNEVSFRQETETIKDFPNNPHIYVLLPEDYQAHSWTERINTWAKIIASTSSGILVIDTFGAFAGLPPGGENDAACVQERLMQLKLLFKAKPNLGIVLIHHVRKPSADPRFVKSHLELRDIRGSSALVGGVDHAVMISKDERARVRNVHIEGRLGPEQDFSIVLTDNGYVQNNTFQSFRRI